MKSTVLVSVLAYGKNLLKNNGDCDQLIENRKSGCISSKEKYEIVFLFEAFQSSVSYGRVFSEVREVVKRLFMTCRK